ncbi:MAG: class I adenylate-forming enzyme family protein [Planctomycetota bacterium]|jgi:acyl-coenzyme A synthetase/AMP-(fatty) acid ligase
MDNIFEAIQRFSFNKGSSPAVFSGDTAVSWGKLNSLIDDVCLGLSRQGMRAGRGVLIMLSKSWHLPVIMLAVIKGRGIVVPADDSFGMKNIIEIVRRSKPDIVIHDNKHLAIAEMLAEKFSFRTAVNIEDTDSDETGGWRKIAGIDSTGANFPEAKMNMPVYHHYIIDDKGVLQCFIGSLKNITLSAYSAKQMFGFAEDDKHLSLLPAGYRVFDTVFRPLLSGGTLIFAKDNNIRDISEAITDYNVTVLQSPPYFWRLLCQWQELTGSNFSSLRIMESCGKTSSYICKKVKSVIGGELYVTRAVGETFGAFLGPKVDKLSGGIKQNQPFPGIQEHIVAGNEILPASDKIGSLSIKSNILAIGRITDNARKNIDLVNDSWLPTGQFAKRTMAGDIELLGGSDAIIRKGGEVLPLMEVESCLERRKDIIEAVVIKISEDNDFAAFYKAEKDSEVSAEDLYKHLKRRLGAQMIPVDIIRIDHFERFPTGQINRKKLVVEYIKKIRGKNRKVKE